MASVVGCELVTSTTRLPLRAQFLQKRFRARQESDARQRLAFQRGDVELKLPRPVVDAIPLQGVRDILNLGAKQLARLASLMPWAAA